MLILNVPFSSSSHLALSSSPPLITHVHLCMCRERGPLHSLGKDLIKVTQVLLLNVFITVLIASLSSFYLVNDMIFLVLNSHVMS